MSALSNPSGGQVEGWCAPRKNRVNRRDGEGRAEGRINRERWRAHRGLALGSRPAGLAGGCFSLPQSNCYGVASKGRAGLSRGSAYVVDYVTS